MAGSIEADGAELLAHAGRIEAGRDIVWDDERGAWLVGSHAAFKEVAADDETFPANGTSQEAMPAGVDRDMYVAFEGGAGKLPFLTGEPHERLHRWWLTVFSPKLVKTLRETSLRPIVHGAIDRFADRGQADLVEELAERVTLPMTLQMMDLPSDQAFMDRYFEPTREVGPLRQRLLQPGGPTPELVRRAVDLQTELRGLLMPYLMERGSGEGDDLISLLWRAAPDLLVAPWDENDIYANVMALFEAGVTTASVGIGDALTLMVQHPELQEALRADRSVAPNFVEESLRLYSPALFTRRYAARDVELHGEQIRKGDAVQMVNLAANRDPERFVCPHEVDLARRPARGHVAFGAGPRHCPGHAVARAQIEESVLGVLDRLEDLRPDPDQPAPRWAGAGARIGFDRLPVRFTAVAAAS
jgi:cytochrome P450